MIRIKDVTKKFGKDFTAVNNLTLEIKDGEIFGFLGPNGAGKTTTIKMITGVELPTEGDIEINDISIVYQPFLAKHKFGFVPDDPNLLLRLTGHEYLNFIGNVYGLDRETMKNRIIEFATRFSLLDDLKDRIETYSHGMRQKLLIIGVLIHQPENWILDEPMTGLDPKSAFDLKNIMREHADKGNSVLFSTHVLEVAEKVCDRVGIINKGKLLFVGTLEELRLSAKNGQTLEELFLELTENVE